jgi:hypothetical protein
LSSDSVGRRWPGGKKPVKKLKPNPRGKPLSAVTHPLRHHVDASPIEAAEPQPFVDEINNEEKFSESEDDKVSIGSLCSLTRVSIIMNDDNTMK